MSLNKEELDYAKNIKLFIEQERLKLISYASINGIPEEEVEKFLKEQNINDFNLDNLKIRLGIIEEKKPRVKKASASKSEQ